MRIIESELNAHFDCDDTLVMWDPDFYRPGHGKLAITDPYDNTVVYLKPHKKHIKILKDLKLRGYNITVWSAAGYKWADAVVKALEIAEHVDMVMTKPIKVFDDLPLAEGIGTRVYVPFTEESDDLDVEDDVEDYV